MWYASSGSPEQEHKRRSAPGHRRTTYLSAEGTPADRRPRPSGGAIDHPGRGAPGSQPSEPLARRRGPRSNDQHRRISCHTHYSHAVDPRASVERRTRLISASSGERGHLAPKSLPSYRNVGLVTSRRPLVARSGSGVHCRRASLVQTPGRDTPRGVVSESPGDTFRTAGASLHTEARA